MAEGPPDGSHVPGTEAGSDDGALAARLDALAELLRRRGVAHERAGAAGANNEIAVIAAVPSEFEAVAGLAQKIRDLGFRFVALDLSAGTGSISVPDDARGRSADPEAP